MIQVSKISTEKYLSSWKTQCPWYTLHWGGVQISLVKDTGAPVNILPLHLLEKFEGEMIFPACASCAQSHFPVIQTHP